MTVFKVDGMKVDKLQNLVAAIHAEGGEARAFTMDVTDSSSVRQGMDALCAWGVPDVVVNNAGVTVTRPALEQSEADFDHVLETNLKGSWLVATEAARRMVSAGQGGSIVNVASILGERVAGGVAPYAISKAGVVQATQALALELGVVGLMNAQFAVKDKTVYVLEVNPRGSRTVPFVSKAIGAPLAKLAMKVMLGKSLQDLGFTNAPQPAHLSVKEAVFPFNKFPGVDVLLGPEMKSTGEVMGIDSDFGWAFAKSQAGAGATLPQSGTAFLSVKESDRPAACAVAKRLRELGFHLQATSGTAGYLRKQGLDVTVVNKVQEGRPHVVDHIKNGEVVLVVNTVQTASAHTDSLSIRREALQKGLPYFTTMRGALAAVMGIEALAKKELSIRSLQEYHRSQV